MLIVHPEEMALVVSLEISAGFHPQEAVVKTLMHRADIASQDQRAGLVGHLAHPFKGPHVHVLGQLGSIHGKTSREHFWQNNHIGIAADLPYFLFKHG